MCHHRDPLFIFNGLPSYEIFYIPPESMKVNLHVAFAFDSRYTPGISNKLIPTSQPIV